MGAESRISPLVRPALLGTVAIACFGVAFLSAAVEGFAPGYGLKFGLVVMQVMEHVPGAVLDLFAWMFGTYAVGKSGERAMHAWSGRNGGVAQSAPREDSE